MKKFFVSLVVVLAMTIAGQGQAQAQLLGVYGGYGLPYGTWLSCNQWLNWFPSLINYPWLTVPGCEAQMVVWSNQAMVWGLGQQASWPYPGWPYAPQQYQFPGAAQPPGQQYIVVRVAKGWGRQLIEVGGWSGVGAAAGGTIAKITGTSVRQGVLLGLLGGGSGGLLKTINDYDSYVIPVPAPQQQSPVAQPPTQQQPPQPPSPSQQPQPAPTRVAAPIALSGVPMVIVNESPFWIHVENETTGEGFVILGPKVEAPDLKAPQGRLRFYIITPENGVMSRREIVPEPDLSLPGWRIPAEPRER